MASVAHSVWAPGNEKGDPSKASRPSGDSAASRGRGGARGRGRGRGRGGYRGGKAGSISDAPADSKAATESSTPAPAPQAPTQPATNTSTSPNAATSVPAPTNTNNTNDSQSRQRSQAQRKRSNIPPIIVEPTQPANDKASKNNRKRGPKPPSRKSSLASTSARSDGEPSPVQSLSAPRTDLDTLVNRTRAMAMGSSVPPSPDMRSFTPTLTWADTENEDLPELDDTWVKKPATAPPTIPSIAEAESLAPHAPSVEVDAKRLSTSSVGSTQAKETKEIPPHQQKKDKGKGRDNIRDRPRSNQPTPSPRSPYVPPVSAGHEPRPNDNSFRGGDSHFPPRGGRGGFAFPRGMRGGPMQRPNNNFHHHNAPPPPPVHVPAEPPAPPVLQEVTFASLNDPAPEDHQPPHKYGNHSPSHFNTFHSPGRGRHLNFNQGFSHQAYSPSNPTSPSSPPGHMRNPSSPHSSGHSRTHSRPVISLDGFAKISKSLGVPSRGTPKSDAAILSSPPAAT